jgi:hypothetical protein
MVSSSCEIASGSRIEIEFWCNTSSNDDIESSSVARAFIVPRASVWASSRRRFSSTFFSSAMRARSGSSGCFSSRCRATISPSMLAEVFRDSMRS